jgi:hypothetical protein
VWMRTWCVKMMSKAASGKGRPERMLAVWKVRLLDGLAELEARDLGLGDDGFGDVDAG